MPLLRGFDYQRWPSVPYRIARIDLENPLNASRFEAKLDQKLAELRTEVRSGAADLRAEIQAGLARLEGGLLARIGTAEGRLARLTLLMWIGTLATLAALLKL